MGINEFAALLDGREYGNEITREEMGIATQLGYVVLYGASDDLAEFRGALDGEFDCYGGGTVKLEKYGLFEECECDCKYSQKAKEKCKEIKIVWGEGEYCWIYETEIPHATFDIMEDGEKYCKGIVFDINSLE